MVLRKRKVERSLKGRMIFFFFLSRLSIDTSIDTDTEASLSLPFDQAWSRASKKVGPSVPIASYAEKYES